MISFIGHINQLKCSTLQGPCLISIANKKGGFIMNHNKSAMLSFFRKIKLKQDQYCGGVCGTMRLLYSVLRAFMFLIRKYIAM